MKTLLLAATLTVALAACSDSSKPLVTASAAPKPAPEVKAIEAPKPDPDKELAARVKKALDEQKPKILGAGIDVTAANGAVTLWGTAASTEERRRAGRVATQVEGVKSLENKLEIVAGS
jgi:osmotically-inducible protein OsmY